MRHAPLAQLDRASGYGPEGREFESLRAYQIPQSRKTLGDLLFYDAASKRDRGKPPDTLECTRGKDFTSCFYV